MRLFPLVLKVYSSQLSKSLAEGLKTRLLTTIELTTPHESDIFRPMNHDDVGHSFIQRN